MKREDVKILDGRTQNNLIYLDKVLQFVELDNLEENEIPECSKCFFTNENQAFCSTIPCCKFHGRIEENEGYFELI